MADRAPIFEYKEESQGERLARKSKDSPFMVIGKCCKIHFTLLCSYPNKQKVDSQLYQTVKYQPQANYSQGDNKLLVNYCLDGLRMHLMNFVPYYTIDRCLCKHRFRTEDNVHII